MKQNSLVLRPLAIILICTLVTSCAHQYHTVSTLPTNYSKEEIELGEAINRQVLQTVPVCQDAQLNQYVQSIGERLAAVAERRDFPYRFVILQDGRIYATRAPGGYVYLTTGFFRSLQNESELAAVLAYEIGSLQYKDPRLSKLKKAFELLLQTGSAVGPAFGSIGGLAVLGLALADNFIVPEKSAERQTYDADKRALRYMTESGYDPQGLIDLLRRLKDPRSSDRPYLYDFLQSHPISTERFQRLDRAFYSLPLANKQFETRRDVFLSMTESLRSSFQKVK